LEEFNYTRHSFIRNIEKKDVIKKKIIIRFEKYIIHVYTFKPDSKNNMLL